MVIAEPTDLYLSWGRYHRYRHRIIVPATIDAAARAVAEAPAPLLPFGLGRSYGDTCLNQDGTLIDTRRLDRFFDFDRETGLLVCEAGVSLGDLLDITAAPLPDGSHWFVPVSPGTRFVTVAGAIANDVHGKNHFRQGTFGRHVRWFDLARSDGVVRCSAEAHQDLFEATIGGLGLTGLILRAAVQLIRVPSLTLEVEEIAMDDLDDYYRLRDESLADWDYCAAWVDVLARGRSLGRGIYTRARHASGAGPATAPARRGGPAVPVDAPAWLLNRFSLRAFNALYARKLLGRRQVRRSAGYEGIFYPLDSIRHWNRLYGRPGFHQYQCVVPAAGEGQAVAALLGRIAASGQGSFLAVLKSFGALASPGLLSFPMHGTTLALDFPNRGARTLDLLDALDEIVAAAGGRVYPAKDGRMSGAMFSAGFPRLDRFKASIDPKFSSSFWRRTAAIADSDR